MKKSLLLLLCSITFIFNSNAQKVAGFIGDWHNVSEINRIQYDKLTDIYFAFLKSDNNGTVSTTTAGSANTHLIPLVSKSHTAGVKCHVSLGGANNSGNLGSVIGNATTRNNLKTSIINFIKTYDLDGFNMDWEFPASNYASSLGTLMKDLRTDMNALEITMGKELELTAAVAPLLWNSDGINADFITACDFIYVMAFDAGGGSCVEDASNHSSMLIAQRSLEKWTTKGLPSFTCGGNKAAMNVDPAKLVLSVPFYSSNPFASYKTFSNANPSQYFNDADGINGGYKYNSKPMIEAKVELIMKTYGGAGIWCWELADDRDDAYSLLSVMWNAMQPYMCAAPQPNLGNDKSICGTTSVALNSTVATASGRTFTWKKGTQTMVNNSTTKNNYDATAAGIYTVIVTQDGCSNEDQIEVLGTLPTVSLGNNFELCNPSTATLDAGVTGSGLTYTWTKNNELISNATASTLNIHQAGTYKITVSASGCSPKTSSVIVTEPNLPSVDDQTRCGAGTVTFAVTNPGANPYRWYSQLDGGTMLKEGSNFTTPSITQTTAYYVEEYDATGGICNGKPDWSSATVYSAAAGTYKVVYNGKLYTNVDWWSQNYNPETHPYWSEVGTCGATCKRKKVIATPEICTGNSIFTEINLFEASPNPAHASLNVQFSHSFNGQLIITNMSGQILQQENSNGDNNMLLNINQLQNGMYLLQAIGEKENQTLRFVKE